jgi:hypothetical protein
MAGPQCFVFAGFDILKTCPTNEDYSTYRLWLAGRSPLADRCLLQCIRHRYMMRDP